MKKFLPVFIVLLISCGTRESFNPDDQLSPDQKQLFVHSIIRYTAKPPRNVAGLDRFNPVHNDYYRARVEEAKLIQYYRDGDVQYFLLTQPAPSLLEKRHATGGRLRMDSAGKVVEYEEVFRTWKMVPDSLAKRGALLFAKMVKGEPLDQYFTKNSGGTEYIEFPDERTYYDKTEREWKIRTGSGN